MQTALVLGTGQVGTFAARRLAEDGADVVAADVLPPSGFFARFGPPGVELAAVNVLDYDAIAALIRRRRTDVVVLAAGVDAASCSRDPAVGWLVNARGAEVVGRAALAGGASRLVLVSSFAVYGSPASGPIPETAPFAPRTVYGRSKAAAELAVLRLAKRGLDLRIVRPCAVYGPTRPGFGSRSTRLVDRLLLAALGAEGAALPEGRAQDDEYIYVKDLAQALALVALDARSLREIAFNVGTGAMTDANALRREVERVLPGHRIDVDVQPAEADGRRYPLDISRIREIFAFEPRYDIARGLRDYLDTVTVP